MKKTICLLFITTTLLYSAFVSACTSFYIEHDTNPVHGANLDWHNGDGMIVINKRGFLKTAVSDPEKHLNPVSWTSSYGSVTFNMYGCDWPWGGMNEAGLSCSSLLLNETKYPIPDSRSSIFMGQWLQYQLDNSSSIQDVIASNTQLRIRETDNKLRTQYFFSDRQGNCAVVEFINGKFIVYNNKTMPVKALTDDRYDLLISSVKKIHSYGGQNSLTNSNLSYMRFVRIADMLNKYNPKQTDSTVDAAFAMLENVSYKLHRTTHTQWRIVFDIQNHRIWYMTRNQKTIKAINMKAIDFACSTPIMIYNIDSPVGAKATDGFVKYDYQSNRTMVEKAFKINPLKPKVSGERLERMAKYPETFVCQQ